MNSEVTRHVLRVVLELALFVLAPPLAIVGLSATLAGLISPMWFGLAFCLVVVPFAAWRFLSPISWFVWRLAGCVRSDETVIVAATRLGQLRATTAVEALKKAYLSASDPKEASAISDALYQIRDRRGIETVLHHHIRVLLQRLSGNPSHDRPKERIRAKAMELVAELASLIKEFPELEAVMPSLTEILGKLVTVEVMRWDHTHTPGGTYVAWDSYYRGEDPPGGVPYAADIAIHCDLSHLRQAVMEKITPSKTTTQ